MRCLNGVSKAGIAKDRPKLQTDIDAANFILRISPETNGSLAYRAWSFVKDQSGVDCSFLSEDHKGDKYTFDDLTRAPRLTFTAPDWSGIINGKEPYSAFVQNVVTDFRGER